MITSCVYSCIVTRLLAGSVVVAVFLPCWFCKDLRGSFCRIVMYKYLLVTNTSSLSYQIVFVGKYLPCCCHHDHFKLKIRAPETEIYSTCKSQNWDKHCFIIHCIQKQNAHKTMHGVLSYRNMIYINCHLLALTISHNAKQNYKLTQQW